MYLIHLQDIYILCISKKIASKTFCLFLKSSKASGVSLKDDQNDGIRNKQNEKKIIGKQEIREDLIYKAVGW